MIDTITSRSTGKTKHRFWKYLAVFLIGVVVGIGAGGQVVNYLAKTRLAAVATKFQNDLADFEAKQKNQIDVQLYFYDKYGALVAVTRTIDKPTELESTVIGLLITGPNSDEKQIQLTSAIPTTASLDRLNITATEIDVKITGLPNGREKAAQDQIKNTLNNLAVDKDKKIVFLP